MNKFRILKILGIAFVFTGIIYLQMYSSVYANDNCPATSGSITQDTVWTEKDLVDGKFDCRDTDLVIDGASLTLKVPSSIENWESLMIVKSLTFKHNGDIRLEIRSKTLIETLTEPYNLGELTVGLTVGLQVLALASVFSLQNIELISVIGIISQAIFSKTYRKNLWGVVYNSYDKKPIPFVVLRLFNTKAKSLLATTVTDLDGRYGFPVTPGNYYMEVEHDEFNFPSKLAHSDLSLEERAVYRGGEFSVSKVTSIDFNIPMDPIGLKIGVTKNFFAAIWSKIKRLMLSGNYIFLCFLFALNLMLTIVRFNVVNLLFAALYFILITLKFFAGFRRARAWGTVFNSKTTIPAPSAFVKLYREDTKKLVDTKVSDTRGRFQFFVPSADYSLLVAASGYRFPSQTIPAEELIYHGSLMKIHTKEGVVNRDVPIDPVVGAEKKVVSPFGSS